MISKSVCYGRDEELLVLRQSLEEVDESSRLLLVAGPKGTGKSFLVETLLSQQEDNSIIENNKQISYIKLKTKLSPRANADKPYSAFQELFVACMLYFSINNGGRLGNDHEESFRQCQSRIQNKLSPSESELILESFPVLRPFLVEKKQEQRQEHMNSGQRQFHALGLRPSDKRLSDNNNQEIDALLIYNVLNAMFEVKSRVIWILDDLHRIDEASLQAIQYLLRETAIPYDMLVIGLYDSDIDKTEEFNKFLDTTIKNPDNVMLYKSHFLQLHNWNQDIVNKFVLDEKQIPIYSSELDWIYKTTKGNPLFIHYLLQYLSLMESDVELSKIDVENFEQLLVLLFRQLPAPTRNALKTMAALLQTSIMNDDCINLAHLILVLQRAEPTQEVLRIAVDLDLITWTEYDFNGTMQTKISFCREDIRRIIYSCIEEVNVLHLKIGRRLWKYYSENEMDGVILSITDQLRLGLSHMTDPEEQNVFASLCAQSGQKVMMKSNFDQAASYFELGISVLGDRVWTPKVYNTSLVLYNSAAEARYCTGDLQRMDIYLQEIFDNAKTLHDELRSYITLVYSNGSRQKLREAVDTAFYVLRQLGESLPTKPGKLRVAARIISMNRLLRTKDEQYFENLPIATDSEKIATMQLLMFVFTSAYITMPESGLYAIFRVLQLTMQYGVSGPSIAALASYAFVLCLAFGKDEEAYRIGQISLRLLEIYDMRPWLPRVYMSVYGLVNQLFHPYRECAEPLTLAYRVALRTGDLEAAMFCSMLSSDLSFQSGLSLRIIANSVKAYSETMERLGQTIGLSLTIPYWQFITDLVGDETNPLILKGEIKDEASALKYAAQDGNSLAIASNYSNRSIYFCLCGDYELSVKFGQLCRKPEIFYQQLFYEGIAALAFAGSNRGTKKRRCLVRLGRKRQKQLEIWSKTCPANYFNKFCLLTAELAAVRGDHVKAMQYYGKSVEAAETSGLIHEKALAYERCGHYFCSNGSDNLSIPFFQMARDAYSVWGAGKLVQRMENLLSTKM